MSYLQCAPVVLGFIRKNAKLRLAASGAQGAGDVTVQTWRARVLPRSLGGDFRRLGALLASGGPEISSLPSWTFCACSSYVRWHSQVSWHLVHIVQAPSSSFSFHVYLLALQSFPQTLRYLGRAFGFDLFFRRLVIGGERSASFFGFLFRIYVARLVYTILRSGCSLRCNVTSRCEVDRINKKFLLNKYILRYPR